MFSKSEIQQQIQNENIGNECNRAWLPKDANESSEADHTGRSSNHKLI